MIALLSSMPFESDLLISRIKRVRTTDKAGRKIYMGKISGTDVLIVNTGIGKVNASHTATAVAENFSVDRVINLGVGGAYPGADLVQGDVAIATKEISGDDGVITPDGWRDLSEIGIPSVKKGRKKYFNEFRLAVPSKAFFKGKVNEPVRISQGVFITVGSATGTQKRAAELEKRFGGICENMEGAAIAQVCAIYGIPMSEVRGMSNIVGVRDKNKWKLKEAAENCQKVVLKLPEFNYSQV